MNLAFIVPYLAAHKRKWGAPRSPAERPLPTSSHPLDVDSTPVHLLALDLRHGAIHPHRPAQANVLGRPAHHELDLARLHDIPHLPVVKAKLVRGHPEPHPRLFPRREGLARPYGPHLFADDGANALGESDTHRARDIDGLRKAGGSIDHVTVARLLADQRRNAEARR